MDRLFTWKHTNVIERDIEYGEHCRIGEFNVIGKNVKLGNNVIIGHHCIIEDDIIIGNNVVIQGNVKIASGCIIKDDCTLKHGTILTNNTTLEKNVFMGPNTITLGGTHERVVNYGTMIGKNCYIGGGTQIAANKKICMNVTTGALSFVNKDIKEEGVYVGVPVRKLR